MRGKKLAFYSKPEGALYKMSWAHLTGLTSPLTECTSWTASLLAALCYATYLAQEREAWVGVVDTHRLRDVLVFNAGRLVGCAELEYQAYGRVAGRGYQAVALDALLEAGLYGVFPELQGWRPPRSACVARELKLEVFGYALRARIFAGQPVHVCEAEVQLAEAVGSLFGGLAMPVVTALLCLRPRTWMGPFGFMRIEHLEALAGVVDASTVPLLTEAWLQSDVLVSHRYPDVRQWIVLFKVLGAYVAQYLESKHGDSGSDDMEGVTVTEKKDWSKILRPRSKAPRQE